MSTFSRNAFISLKFVRNTSSYKHKVINTIPAGLHRELFLSPPPDTSVPKEFALEWPKLRGRDIEEHFQKLGEEQALPYRTLLDQTATAFGYDYEHVNYSRKDWTQELVPRNQPVTKFYPLELIDWKLNVGWTRYSHNDGSSRSVPCPEENVFIFDTEVCVMDGIIATMAVALSNKAWYGWCSERLVNNVEYPQLYKLDHLIPLGDSKCARIIIGHNVGFDRVRVRECYLQEDTSVRFMDTMSMTVSMYGKADHQIKVQDDIEEEQLSKNKKIFPKWESEWNKRVTNKGLKDVAEFLLGIPIKKEEREHFLKDDINTIRENYKNLFVYCAKDTLVTALIFSKMWAEYNKRFPWDATLVGMLEMGNAYLPINEGWKEFYNKSNEDSGNEKTVGSERIIKAAVDLIKKSDFDKELKNDLWMFPHNKQTEETEKVADSMKKKKLFKNDETDPPDWFLSLFKYKKTGRSVYKNMQVDPEAAFVSGEDVIAKSSLIPSIFGVIYHSYPVHKIDEHGWGYLTQKSRKKARETYKWDLGVPTNFKEKVQALMDDFGEAPLPDEVDIRFADCDFYKIPHPSGNGNVGDLTAKGFRKDFESGVLRATRREKDFNDNLKCLKDIDHWVKYRKRYNNELDVYFDDTGKVGAIAPSIVPAGTITRRSVHPLWVTLTNSSDDSSIGKGIKNMVQAPTDMVLIGADVDSQEQWLAGIFGDGSVAKYLDDNEKRPGLTPFANMMLAGSKSDSSDLHSVIARDLKIDRDSAKVLNYARLYGAGQHHAEKILQKSLSVAEAQKAAAKLFQLTKGMQISCCKLSSMAVPLFKDFEDIYGEQDKIIVNGNIYLPSYLSEIQKPTIPFEEYVLQKLREEGDETNEHILTFLYDDISNPVKLYYKGYESAAFNFLEQESKKQELRTPVLDCQISNALCLPIGTPEKEYFDRKFRRSVMNWIVQSSAVDFLHLLLVSVKWLAKEYCIPMRFAISIHDEVRYLCQRLDAPRAALALMIAHLQVRAFISQRVGIKQLPMSVAFFSQVDCDTVLRKEVNFACYDPDGNRIIDGEAWNIDDILKKTGGSLLKLETSDVKTG